MEDIAPPPFLSSDIDLSKLDGFMLDTVRLLGSELVAISTGDEFKAAVLLWCRAWKQRPACSLPNDERILASFAGVPVAKWKKVRAVAMRGFIRCSDGRWYHKVLAEDAKRAWDALVRRRERTKAATEARKNPRYDQRNVERNDERNEPRNEVPRAMPATGRDGTGRDATASPLPNPLPIEPSPTVNGRVKINGFGNGHSGRNGKFEDESQRDAFAHQACLPYMPGRDNGERWSAIMAAEDPEAPGHVAAVSAMIKAAKRAKVGWVSPEIKARRVSQ